MVGFIKPETASIALEHNLELSVLLATDQIEHGASHAFVLPGGVLCCPCSSAAVQPDTDCSGQRVSADILCSSSNEGDLALSQIFGFDGQVLDFRRRQWNRRIQLQRYVRSCDTQ